MDRGIAAGIVPGAVGLIDRHGQTEVFTAGTMEIGGDEPVQRDTIFRIASMTKPIIAAAVMMLVDDGKLRARRTGRPAAARAGRSPRAAQPGRRDRRYRAGGAANHGTSPSDQPDGAGYRLAARRLSDCTAQSTHWRSPVSACRIRPRRTTMTHGCGGSVRCRCSSSRAGPGSTPPRRMCRACSLRALRADRSALSSRSAFSARSA